MTLIKRINDWGNKWAGILSILAIILSVVVVFLYTGTIYIINWYQKTEGEAHIFFWALINFLVTLTLFIISRFFNSETESSAKIKIVQDEKK